MSEKRDGALFYDKESIDKSDFLEKAEIILKPYYREVQQLEQNVCI